MPGLQLHVSPCCDDCTCCSDTSGRAGRLLSEIFDITPEKRRNLLVALRQATEEDDWFAFCLNRIEPDHTQAKRARAMAEVTGKSERQCIRDIRGETDCFSLWPLVTAAAIDFMTLRGAGMAVHAATSLPPEFAEKLIGAALGPVRT